MYTRFYTPETNGEREEINLITASSAIYMDDDSGLTLTEKIEEMDEEIAAKNKLAITISETQPANSCLWAKIIT